MTLGGPMGYGDRLIAVVGLAFEARIAAGPGVRVICSGNGKELAASLSKAIAEGATGVVSFGVAGGLAPARRPGAFVLRSALPVATRPLKPSATRHPRAQKT